MAERSSGLAWRVAIVAAVSSTESRQLAPHLVAADLWFAEVWEHGLAVAVLAVERRKLLELQLQLYCLVWNSRARAPQLKPSASIEGSAERDFLRSVVVDRGE